MGKASPTLPLIASMEHDDSWTIRGTDQASPCETLPRRHRFLRGELRAESSHVQWGCVVGRADLLLNVPEECREELS